MDTAHKNNIYVILDIIFNHSGDVFDYDADRYFTGDGHGGHYMDPRWDNHPYRVKGYRNANGSPRNSICTDRYSGSSRGLA